MSEREPGAARRFRGARGDIGDELAWPGGLTRDEVRHNVPCPRCGQAPGGVGREPGGWCKGSHGHGLGPIVHRERCELAFYAWLVAPERLHRPHIAYELREQCVTDGSRERAEAARSRATAILRAIRARRADSSER